MVRYFYLLAATSQFSVLIDQKMHLTGWDNGNKMRKCDRRAWRHKLQYGNRYHSKYNNAPILLSELDSPLKFPFTHVDYEFCLMRLFLCSDNSKYIRIVTHKNYVTKYHCASASTNYELVR